MCSQPAGVGFLVVAFFRKAGQLPHAAEKAGFFSLGQKNQPVSLRPELKDGDRYRWFFGGYHRQGALGSGFASCAHIAHGAYRTIGVFGQADTSAQVHQRLVEIAGPCARNQRLCFLADGFFGGWRADGNREVENPAHDTQDVPVDSRATLPEGDAGDRPRHVGADPRQSQQRLARFGYSAAAHHLLCGAV